MDIKKLSKVCDSTYEEAQRDIRRSEEMFKEVVDRYDSSSADELIELDRKFKEENGYAAQRAEYNVLIFAKMLGVELPEWNEDKDDQGGQEDWEYREYSIRPKIYSILRSISLDELENILSKYADTGFEYRTYDSDYTGLKRLDSMLEEYLVDHDELDLMKNYPNILKIFRVKNVGSRGYPIKIGKKCITNPVILKDRDTL